MNVIMILLCAAPITLVRLPGGEVPPRAHVDEASLAQTGVGLATQAGFLDPARAPALRKTLEQAYRQMSDERGATPSPAVGTLADEQSAKGFDLVLVPATGPERDTAAIFLHGFGGNSTLECWLAGRALAAEGVLTACPSIGLEASWNTSDGRAVVDATRHWLEKKGKRRFLLVGLSNGAVGAAQLGARDESQWAGVACLEGAAPLPKTTPTLLVSASRDAFNSPAAARSLARGHSNVQLAELEGDHFAALERRDELAKILRDFAARTASR